MIANAAPPIELRSPYFAMPTISNSRAGPSAATPMRSPSCRFSSSASPSSIATSSPPLAQRPSTRLSGLNRSYSGAVSMPKANCGAPPAADALPVGSQQLDLEVQERAGRDLDPVYRAHALERLLGNRRRLRGLSLEAETRVLPRHDRVRPRVRVDEDRVERVVDRVVRT